MTDEIYYDNHNNIISHSAINGEHSRMNRYFANIYSSRLSEGLITKIIIIIFTGNCK